MSPVSAGRRTAGHTGPSALEEEGPRGAHRDAAGAGARLRMSRGVPQGPSLLCQVGRGSWAWVGDVEGPPARAPLYCAIAKNENKRDVDSRVSRLSDRRGSPCPSGASLSGLHVVGTRVPVSGCGCVFWPSGPCGLVCRHLSLVRGDRWDRRLAPTADMDLTADVGLSPAPKHRAPPLARGPLGLSRETQKGALSLCPQVI